MLMMRRDAPRGDQTMTTRRASSVPIVMNRSSPYSSRRSGAVKLATGEDLAGAGEVETSFGQRFRSLARVERDFHAYYCMYVK